MTVTHHEEFSDVRRLRENGPQELGKQFDEARARLRKMIGIRMNKVLIGRIDPSDIIQEAFIQASRRLPEYLDAPRISPFLWLRQVVRQTLAVEYRRHIGTAKRAIDREVGNQALYPSADSMVLELETSMLSPHSEIARAELTGKLLDLLQSMDTRDREVLALKQLEQLSFAEVAAELETTVEAAMKRYQRAILRLGRLAAHLDGD